jgi:hypothetical protein
MQTTSFIGSGVCENEPLCIPGLAGWMPMETEMTITRRLFLRNTVSAGAVAATVAAPVVAAEPEMSPHDQAWWHIRELERLAIEDGGAEPIIIIQAEYGPEDYRGIGINAYGTATDSGMFATEGGAA